MFARLPFLYCAKTAVLAENKEEGVHNNFKLGGYRKRQTGHIIQVCNQIQEMNEDIILTVEERPSRERLTYKMSYVNPE